MFDHGSRDDLARAFSSCHARVALVLLSEGALETLFLPCSKVTGHPAQRKYLTLSFPDVLQCTIECKRPKTSQTHLHFWVDPSWGWVWAGKAD